MLGGTLKRVLTLGGAVLALLAGAWVSLWALIYGSGLQPPDPAPSLDGDPCCPHPDTWGDVAVSGVYTLLAAVLAAALFGGAAILTATAIRGRVPVRSGRARGG